MRAQRAASVVRAVGGSLTQRDAPPYETCSVSMTPNGCRRKRKLPATFTRGGQSWSQRLTRRGEVLGSKRDARGDTFCGEVGPHGFGVQCNATRVIVRHPAMDKRGDKFLMSFHFRADGVEKERRRVRNSVLRVLAFQPQHHAEA